MWGMPIGEFFDLEALAKHAAETGRYTFFFSSWPLNVCVNSLLDLTSSAKGLLTHLCSSSLGGVASPPNAAVSAVIDLTAHGPC